MSYKYGLDSKVTINEEITIFSTDDDTGEEQEIVIPAGAKGHIFSQGRDSRYGFKPMYDVEVATETFEGNVTFFEKDLESVCTIEPFEE